MARTPSSPGHFAVPDTQGSYNLSLYTTTTFPQPVPPATQTVPHQERSRPRPD